MALGGEELTSKLADRIAWQDIPKGVARPFRNGQDTYYLREDVRKIVELKDEGRSIAEISRLTGHDEDAVEWALAYATKHMLKTSPFPK
jgi:hypothetical protein